MKRQNKDGTWKKMGWNHRIMYLFFHVLASQTIYQHNLNTTVIFKMTYLNLSLRIK